jgi:hypothetical protein
MALIRRQEIIAAFQRLGELAKGEGHTLHLVVLGGAAMVLGYNARQATHDIDAFFVPPPDAQVARQWVKTVARERGWPDDWLNDAAKGYLKGISEGPVLFRAPGIIVAQPAPEQLLAMKLCAWRDDVDIADAGRILAELSKRGNRTTIWQQILPYIPPGSELKAQYAFDDLWESLYGTD